MSERQENFPFSIYVTINTLKWRSSYHKLFQSQIINRILLQQQLRKNIMCTQVDSLAFCPFFYYCCPPHRNLSLLLPLQTSATCLSISPIHCCLTTTSPKEGGHCKNAASSPSSSTLSMHSPFPAELLSPSSTHPLWWSISLVVSWLPLPQYCPQRSLHKVILIHYHHMSSPSQCPILLDYCLSRTILQATDINSSSNSTTNCCT